MKLIINPSTDPAFNLAMEEYMLTQKTEDIMMLWRNDKAVIIGNNQNAIEEMDLDYIQENNVTVIRRLTGGGAVFHDLGNINFTFIEGYTQGKFGDYARFTAPICNYLNTLGVNAQLSGRNDLTIDGMKFSGNAQTVKNNRIMHHGTLLFSADMTDLSRALKPKQAKIESKGIKSVRSYVTNISSHLKQPMTTEEFMLGLKSYLLKNTPDVVEYTLTEQDIAAARRLVKERYGLWEWNFGKSPAYNFEKSFKFPFGLVEVRLIVEKGVIQFAKLYGDFFGILDIARIEQALTGIQHQKDSVEKALSSFDLSQYISGITSQQLTDLIV